MELLNAELIEAVLLNGVIRKAVHRMKIAVLLPHHLLREAVIRVEAAIVHVHHLLEEHHARVVEVAEAVEEDKSSIYVEYKIKGNMMCIKETEND